MSTTNEVTQTDLQDLLHIFEKKPFEAGSCEEGSEEYVIAKRCEGLFKLDYTIVELDNTNGVLCPRYPSRIFIPESEHGHMASTITANNPSLFSPPVDNATPQNSNTILNGLYQNNSSLTSSLSSSNTTESSTTPSSSITNIDGIHSFVTFASTTNANQNQQDQEQQTQESQETPQNLNQSQQPYYHYQQQLSFMTGAATATPVPPPSSNSTAINNATTTTTTKPKTIYEDPFDDVNKIRELVSMAKYARCRQRFAVPVIMYRGKYICRSATISINAETYGRKVVDYAYDCLNGTNYSEQRGAGNSNSVDDENNDNEDSLMNHALNEQSPFTYEEVIKSDIQLLTSLKVNTIVDLMVEKRKIKYFMAVSSSEKADPDNHYENFNILSLPYPGCEFFKKFRDNNYVAQNLYYNWNQSFNDANISIPTLGPTNELNINWSEYKSWDLVQATQNYLKACLKYIKEEKSGLLIHCISGWDRTPLFITLVRLSLWADGLIHQSLNALQITYLTVAYDWYLFSHQLPDRLKRGEDIMFFCFHVLKFLIDEEFSIIEHRKRTKTSSSSGSSSVIVLKRDSGDDESLKDKEDFVLDQDSNESFSNSSNCDMSMTENFYATGTPISATVATQTSPPQCSSNSSSGNNPITNRSPNPKRSKTSPISVPGANDTRQRQESISSNASGSWQVVNETGSIDSTVNGSFVMRNANSSGNSGTNTNTPSNNSNTNSNIPSSVKQALNIRMQRLKKVRALFIGAYGQTIGLKFKEGSAMNIATFIGTFADNFF